MPQPTRAVSLGVFALALATISLSCGERPEHEGGPTGQDVTANWARHGGRGRAPALPTGDKLELRSDFSKLSADEGAASAEFAALAATFTVNTTFDTVDETPGDGICADSAARCSLRAAVMETNALAGADTISLPAGVYRLTLAGANENDAVTGDLDVLGGLTIQGSGAATTIIEAGPDRATAIDKVLSINPRFTTAFDTTISDVTIRHGRNPSPYSGDGFGGGLDWEATGSGNLTVTNCIIEDNETTDGDGGGVTLTNSVSGPGKAVFTNTVISNNRVARTDAANSAFGGGMFVGTQTTLHFTGGSFTGNAALQAEGEGGAVYLFGPRGGAGQSFFSGTTFSGNQAASHGGAIFTGQGLWFGGRPVFDGNVSGGNGGALLHNTTNETTTLSAATFLGNQAAGTGGAIHVGGSTIGNLLEIEYSRIVGNTAASASGLSSAGGTATAALNWWGCPSGPAAAPCDTATASANVTVAPWLTVTHTASPSTLQLDDSTTLTASILRDSQGAAVSVSNLILLVGLPISFENATLGTISGAQTTIPSDGTATATFKATGARNAGADAKVDAGAARATITVLEPDLVITKSHTPGFTQGDEGRTYVLEVSNVGPGRTSAIEPVVVVDTLPTGLTATGFAGTGWSCTLSPLRCTRGDVLASGAKYPPLTLTVDVAFTAPPNVTNSATVSGGGELDATNSTVDDPTVIIQLPDLVLAKSHVGDFRQGQTGASYSLVAKNIGGSPTNGTVTVTDTLPAGLTATAIAGTGWSCALATLSCTRTDALAVDASYPPITLTVDVANDAAPLVTNSAQVSGGNEYINWNNGAADATTVIQVADLTIAKSHLGDFRQGQSGAQYTLIVSNVGPGPTVGSVSVADALPAGLTATAISGSGWGCSLSPLGCTRSDVLANGASYPSILLTVDVAADAQPALTNTASVSGGGELVTTNDSATDPTTVEQVADLVIAKTHSGDFRQGQAGATYTLTVSNEGPGPTVGSVSVVDTLPAGLLATGLTGTGWTCDPGTLTCTRSDALGAGAAYPPVTLTVDVAKDAPAAVTNTATVSGGGELVTTNDSASDPTVIEQVADLTIAKSHSGDFRQGQSGATYTLAVSNAGPGPTVGAVTVTDTLPAGLTATAIAGAGWTCDLGTLSCTRSDALGVGASYPPITLTVDVAEDAPGLVTNVATVSGGGELNTTNNVASDPTTLIQVADLTIAKSHPGVFRQGGTGTYELVVSNTGPGPTDGTVTVVDTLPAGLTATAIFGDGWTCDLGTLSCTRSDVLASSGLWPMIVVAVDVADDAPASLTNVATVSGGGELNTANDSASDPTNVEQVADLVIAKTHSGDFRQGGTGTWTLAVSNPGRGPTVGTVTVTDSLPTGVTATAISGTGWTCSLATASCTRSDVLAAGEAWPAITLTVDVADDAPATITNVATVSGGGELNTANDSASDPTTVDQAPDLVVTKSHVGSFRQGQQGAVYTLTVSNVGPGPTGGTVTLVDALPSGLTATAITGEGWTCDAGTLTCTRSDALAAGAAYPDVTLVVSVANDAPASVTNSATVSGGGQLDTTNDAASDPTTIVAVADLVLAKSHVGDFRQGQTGATYQLVVSNTGPGPTVGEVTVTDTLPAGLTATAIAGAGWSCTLSPLGCTRSDALGASGSYPAILLTVDVAANAPAQVTNSAAVTGGGELETTNDGASDPTNVIQVADLVVSKTHSGDFRQGGTGSYTLVVSNQGFGATVGVVELTDTLPAGLTATALNGSGWTCTLATLSCTRTDALAAGASYPPVTLVVAVAADAPAQVTNTATVSGGGELDTTNDGASDPTNVVQVADLVLAKSHVGDFVQGQSGASYTLVVSNQGPGPTDAQVTVTDVLPAGLTATGIAGDGWTCDLATLTCTRADVLSAGASYPEVTVTVDVSATVGTSLVNTAFVSGGGELDSTNNDAADPTAVVQVSDLTVTKSHAGDFRQGETGATYTLVVGNAGPGATRGEVILVDTLPEGLTATDISGDGWTCALETLTCVRSDALAVGASHPAVTVTVDVAGNAPSEVTNVATVSGGGELETGNDSASDVTTIVFVADLTVSATQPEQLFVGQTGASLVLTVANEGGGETLGEVALTAEVAEGLLPTAIAGEGWTCALETLRCTRADVLAPGGSYPAVTITADVAGGVGEAALTASVSGGGELALTNNTANATTEIVAPPARGCGGCGATGGDASSVLSLLTLALVFRARRKKQDSQTAAAEIEG